MIKVSRLGHATFETPDLEGAVDYYVQVIGLFVAARDKSRVFLSTQLGQLAVELRKGEHARCIGLSFEVPPESGLRELAGELAGLGVTADVLEDDVPGIPKMITFTDPKGTRIHLFSKWHPLTRHWNVSGVGPLKLGHLAFTVPEPKAIANFYQNILGFRVSDWIEDFFVFLRCNADHHTVNFIRGPQSELHHFAFELRDTAHVHQACDLLGQRNIPIDWGPVRLGPGHNVGIFHRNADEQVVELYSELDQMKDEALGYFDPRPWHRDQPQRPKTWLRTQSTIWGPQPPPLLRGPGAPIK
jgi:catechol 2,3-dioxygenase-like lactoylglutathione lyase family enzyme